MRNSENHEYNNSPGTANNERRMIQGSDQSPLEVPTDVPVLGWREWISLPQLGLPAIKAKVDTGARTSALHAFDTKPFKHEDGSEWVAFSVCPVQRDSSLQRRCQAPVVDVRSVTDSGGHAQERFCIATEIVIGQITRTVEITLASREDMLFRMLLGRTALIPDIMVNPQLSYTLGRLNARSLYNQSVAGSNP